MGAKYYRQGYGWVVVAQPPGTPADDDNPADLLEIVDVETKPKRAKPSK